MSRFTQSVTKIFDFDGDKVTVKMNRISRRHLMSLSPHLPQAGQEPTQAQNIAIMDAVAEFLPGYVREFSGLKDADGADLHEDVLLEEAYFQELLGEVIGWWLTASQMQAEEVGKPKGRQRAGIVA